MTEEQTGAPREKGTEEPSVHRCDPVISSIPIRVDGTGTIEFDSDLHDRLEELEGHVDVCPAQVSWRVYRVQDGEDAIDDAYEFQITNIEPVVDDEHPRCAYQPLNPFTRHPTEKRRDNGERWYVEEVFYLLPEAFPGISCRCMTHEWKASALVRAIADRWGDGTPIDPHVETHPGRGDRNAP